MPAVFPVLPEAVSSFFSARIRIIGDDAGSAKGIVDGPAGGVHFAVKVCSGKFPGARASRPQVDRRPAIVQAGGTPAIPGKPHPFGVMRFHAFGADPPPLGRAAAGSLRVEPAQACRASSSGKMYPVGWILTPRARLSNAANTPRHSGWVIGPRSCMIV